MLEEFGDEAEAGPGGLLVQGEPGNELAELGLIEWNGVLAELEGQLPGDFITN